MDRQIIAEKLESLRHCISRVEQKRPSKAAAFEDDFDLQDIISVNLERAVQLCVDISSHILSSSEQDVPDTMADTFLQLNKLDILTDSTAKVMKKAVGFRNIAVHNYHKINWEIVFNITKYQVDDFKQFAHEVNAYLDS
ncbi:MAG TPA: DUF86 domain-containing protein [Fodinibius sp.]|nr:DUF86 domain-containing protein [Fodinibius sp.]